MNRNIVFLIVLIVGTIFWFSKEAQIVLGGIALFFLGMYTLEHGMKNFAGGALETFLKKTTDTTPKAIGTGFLTTALVQSSSLVSLIAISFLGAGLIKLSAGIGIIFGSNLGTTATSWLVALFGLKLKISSYALAMAALGTVFNFSKVPTLKGVANILIGLALLLLAIGFMKEGFESVKETIDLSQFAIRGIKGLIIFTFVGIFATVVMQSSSATMALILTALATGQITYENSLALAIGANVGTTITAILGSLTSNASGKKLALAHLIFNLVTAAIAIIFLNQFILAVQVLSNYFNFGGDTVMQLSLFHTMFNIVGIVIMTPLIPRLENYLHRAIKEKESKKGQPKFINDSLIENGTSAVTAAKSEIERLYKNATEIIIHALNFHVGDIKKERDLEEAIASGTASELVDVDIEKEYDTNIKPLYNYLVEFSTRAQVNMKDTEIRRMYYLKSATRDIVKSIKETKEIRENIERFFKTDNEDIKQQYNVLRISLGKLLQKAYKLRKDPENTMLLVKFVSLKRMLEESDVLLTGSVDKLIRDGKITPAMATSLINDSSFAYKIGEKIIGVVEALYIYENEDMKAIYQHLLNEEEGERHESIQAI